ncbi:putative metallocarboxypeptidase ecm14 [Conoideocrella luteorostrata]|uniref:Inactive metallocarboxypeptidase ECM14 n=1 Tax=Conoideocrella luteorostrata TaxID=1105319 RepID=A0AAJ0CXS5_9HYPO|nr:putative metallocarboxypeptidase ecm14 [Conoideocrella luteorostrata]
MRLGFTPFAASALLLLRHPDTCLAFGMNLQNLMASIPNTSDIRSFPILAKFCRGAFEFLVGRRPAKGIDQTTLPKRLRARYANELVLRFNVTTPQDEAALAAAAARLFLDVWAFTDDFVDIRLHHDEVSPLLGLLPPSLQTAQTPLISDLASAIYNSLPSRNTSYDPEMSVKIDQALFSVSASVSATEQLFFQDYQPLPVIVRWMRLLEAMFPSYVEYISIGASFEGREIAALRLRVSSPVDNATSRKTIIVTGGLHAREWISTSTVNYLAWSFIMTFGKERMITKLLHEFDIIFVPTVNPDGMEYSWQVDRLWRKSRQQTNLRYCLGLDLDHTFGYGWDGSHPLADPCSESYGGEQPFQAVETMQLATWARNEALNNNVKFVGLVDLHSYSQQILFPYAFSCRAIPPNLENLEELAAGIAKAIRIANGESYSVASACEGAVARVHGSQYNQSTSRMETGGGSAIDWFYHEMGAHFSYQIKLRDTGSYGFLLPKEHIVPTGEEVFNAMKYFGDFLLGNNGIEKLLDDIGETRPPDAAWNKNDTISIDHELKRRRVRR